MFFSRKKDYIDYRKLDEAIETIKYNNDCKVVSHVYYDLSNKDIVVIASDSSLGYYDVNEKYQFFLTKFNHTTVAPSRHILENLIVDLRKRLGLKI